VYGGEAVRPLPIPISQPSCIIVGHSVACAGMDFELVGEMTQIETIARGSGVRDRARLRRYYGLGRWRKLKGIARVRLVDGTIRLAEIHWYEVVCPRIISTDLDDLICKTHPVEGASVVTAQRITSVAWKRRTGGW
jgi:hypothetical protein